MCETIVLPTKTEMQNTKGRLASVFIHLGVKTLFIEPGSLWEKGYVESFNGKMRDELLDREIFFTVEES